MNPSSEGGTGGRIAITAMAAFLVACGGDKNPVEPAVVAAVQVTSPVDSILALGRTAQLTATARDQAGNPMLVSLTWQSSNTGVVTVTAAGLVAAAGTGTATVTASVGSVSGIIRLRVAPADLPTASGLAADAFAGVLVAGLTSAKRTALEAAFAPCATGASSGNIVAIQTCVDNVRAQASTAADPTDRALLAVLVLYADQIERLLGL